MTCERTKDSTIAKGKRINNDLPNITQKTKDWETPNKQKNRLNSLHLFQGRLETSQFIQFLF